MELAKTRLHDSRTNASREGYARCRLAETIAAAFVNYVRGNGGVVWRAEQLSDGDSYWQVSNQKLVSF